jgi:mRNA interferase RelE/StbE
VSWQVVWTGQALKDAEKLSARTRERVVAAIERLATTNQGDVKRLAGPAPEWRLRVGAWRVRFTYDVDAGTMTILHVLPRGRAYR